MMLHLSMGVLLGGEQVDDACIWARVRGLIIIWKEMQSLMVGMIGVYCCVRIADEEPCILSLRRQ